MQNALRNTGERAGSNWDPGALRARLASVLAGGGRGKKTSGRTPLEPKRAPQHHLARWRDEGRQALILEAIRLGVIESGRPAVGPRFGYAAGQFRTWKTLAVAVERARLAKLRDGRS